LNRLKIGGAAGDLARETAGLFKQNIQIAPKTFGIEGGTMLFDYLLQTLEVVLISRHPSLAPSSMSAAGVPGRGE